MPTGLRTAFLTGLILALIAANGVLFVQLRSYYVLSKQLAAEPHNIGRFAAANSNLTSDAPLVVLFGDSRVARWSPAPADGSGAQVVNRGISGETTEQMRLRFAEDVLALRPAVVIVQAGINDLVAAGLANPEARQRIVARCIDNLEAFARQSVAAGSRVVLTEIVPPGPVPLLRRPFWDDSIRDLVAEVNTRLVTLGTSDDIITVSLEPALKTEAGDWRPGVLADTLHFSPAGYEAINALMSPLLARMTDDALQ